jgi:hypothetical protein
LDNGPGQLNFRPPDCRRPESVTTSWITEGAVTITGIMPVGSDTSNSPLSLILLLKNACFSAQVKYGATRAFHRAGLESTEANQNTSNTLKLFTIYYNSDSSKIFHSKEFSDPRSTA